jgi:hypothetical protein
LRFGGVAECDENNQHRRETGAAFGSEVHGSGAARREFVLEAQEVEDVADTRAGLGVAVAGVGRAGVVAVLEAEEVEDVQDAPAGARVAVGEARAADGRGGVEAARAKQTDIVGIEVIDALRGLLQHADHVCGREQGLLGAHERRGPATRGAA